MVKNHAKMGPRAPWRAPNSEKRLRGEFLGLAPTLMRFSRKSVSPNATWVVDLVHFLVQPLLSNLQGNERASSHTVPERKRTILEWKMKRGRSEERSLFRNVTRDTVKSLPPIGHTSHPTAIALTIWMGRIATSAFPHHFHL